MAAYEMNYFKDSYQKAVIDNAKYFAKALHEAGLHVLGDPTMATPKPIRCWWTWATAPARR